MTSKQTEIAKIHAVLISLALVLLLLAGCDPPIAAPLPPITATPKAKSTDTAVTIGGPLPTSKNALPTGCPPKCAGATLYRARLAEMDLREADLRGAYLRLADLQGTILEGADLRLAQLDGANLTGADLRDAVLQGAQLRPALPDGPSCPGLESGEGMSAESEACPARLVGADLSRAVLRDAALNEADLSGAILREADLRDSDLRGTILEAADLAGAALRGADLRGADLTGADLAGADVGDADLRDAVVSNEELEQVLADRGGVRPGPAMDCTLQEPPGLSDPIWEIEIAPEGSVWVAGSRGVARLDLKSGEWTPYTEEDGLPLDRVGAITAEADGSVWLVLRQEGGVAHFDGEEWKYYRAGDDGLISNAVNEVTIAPDGAVWFATNDGVSRWERQSDTWTRYTERDGLENNRVWRVLFTRDGKIWFAHMVGMTVLQRDESGEEEDVWARVGSSSFLASTEAKIQGHGRMWLGQAYYDPFEEEWVDTVYRDFEVQDLAVDKWGGLWIGRRDGAYYIPDPQSSPREEWQHYGREQGLPDDNVLVIEAETNGIVWFGTAGGAVRCVVDTGQGPGDMRAPEVAPTPVR